MKGSAFKTADLSDLSHLLWGPQGPAKSGGVHQSTQTGTGHPMPCPALNAQLGGSAPLSENGCMDRLPLEPDLGPSAKSLLQILPKRWEPAKKALLRTKGRSMPLERSTRPSAVAMCCMGTGKRGGKEQSQLPSVPVLGARPLLTPLPRRGRRCYVRLGAPSPHSAGHP